jgi:hypothetical protein
MTPEQRIGPDGRDDDLTRALRRIYAAPAGDEYWRALEARIASRIAAEGARSPADAWWLPLSRWGLGGIAAASLALAIAGATLWRARELQQRSALAAMLLQSNAPPAQLAAAAGAKPDNDAVLRYVLQP